VLECWSVGVLECWSVGVLECWSVGVLECWSVSGAIFGVCNNLGEEHDKDTSRLRDGRIEGVETADG
jgi:hypothetical protein